MIVVSKIFFFFFKEINTFILQGYFQLSVRVKICIMLQKITFQIITVLMNFLFIKKA